MNQMWQNLKARQPKGTGINRQSPTYDYEMQRHVPDDESGITVNN